MELENERNNALLTQLDAAADKLAHMERKYIQALAMALPSGSKTSSEGENTTSTETQGSVISNRRGSYGNDGDFIGVDDIYGCNSSDENRNEVSPIFSRNSSRSVDQIQNNHAHNSISFSPTPSTSVTSNKSPFASHLVETAGPQVNPLSSKNWIWK
jgi:hypothetical protein